MEILGDGLLKNITIQKDVDSDEELKKRISRHWILMLISFLILLVIFAKAFFLQVVNHDYYSASAKSKARRVIEVSSPRGEIVDAKNKVLAGNERSYALMYSETAESKKVFTNTIVEVLKILKNRYSIISEENDLNMEVNMREISSGNFQEASLYKSLIDDDLPLKIYPFRFEFNAVDDVGKSQLELIFKNNIGLGDFFAKKTLNKEYNNLNSSEKEKIDKLSLAYSAEDTFKYLIAIYKLPQIYDLETTRDLIVVYNKVKFQSFNGNKTITIVSEMDKDTAFLFKQKLRDMPGIFVESMKRRIYPYGESASSIIGYLSKVDDKRYEEKGYDLSVDYIGVDGIEKAFESQLKGTKGFRINEIRSGTNVNEVASLEPYPGKNIKLTIDMDVQAVAEKALNDTMKDLQSKDEIHGSGNATRGACVALNIKTGAVVAMASLPGFDPNDFIEVGGLSAEKWNKYYGTDYEAYGKAMGWSQEKIDKIFPKNIQGVREDFYDYLPKPMLNYATQSLAPPGSTFKVFTGYMGLNEGIITPRTTYNDQGFYDDGNGFLTKFHDEMKNGSVNLTKALKVSSNPYFMDTARLLYYKFHRAEHRERLGIEKPLDFIAKYSWNFGLGADPNDKKGYPNTGVEIPEISSKVFSSDTISNSIYLSNLDTIMKALAEGHYIREDYVSKEKFAYNFKPIDLYYRDNDSTQLYNYKKAIKDYIKEIVVKGYSDPKELRELIHRMIDEDKARYNGVTFSETSEDGKILGDIDTIVNNVIIDVALHDGYSAVNAPYNVYNASIGQGYTQVTPLQLASAFATFYNGGTRLKVHLLDEIQDQDGTVVFKQEPEVISTYPMNKDYLEVIKKGNYEMINNQYLVSGYFNNLPVVVGGKTGSATFRNDQTDFGRNAFAWLMTFAPFDDPEIVVVTVIFDGHWGRLTSPVNAAVMRAYFDSYKKKNY